LPGICEKEKIKSFRGFYFFISALRKPEPKNKLPGICEKEKIKSFRGFYFFISALRKPEPEK